MSGLLLTLLSPILRQKRPDLSKLLRWVRQQRVQHGPDLVHPFDLVLDLGLEPLPRLTELGRLRYSGLSALEQRIVLGIHVASSTRVATLTVLQVDRLIKQLAGLLDHTLQIIT